MAKSRSIGGIYASLSLKDKGFQSGLKSAQKGLNGFASSMATLAKGAALAAPAAAFAGLAVSMKSAIDAGGALNDMMARTGAAGEGLFVMQRAFENAGISGDKVPAVLNKMQKALAGVNEDGEQTNKAFEKLGISASSLTSKDPVAAFKDLAKSISSIEDPAQRTAIAMELFGKSGGELLAVFTDSEAFSQAEQQVGSLGKTLADNAAKLDAVGDAFGGISTKLQSIGAEVSVSLLPQLESVAETLNGMDFSHIGQGLGDAIQKASRFAQIMTTLAKVTPLGYAISSGANAAYGGSADAVKAASMAVTMAPKPEAYPEPYAYGNLPVPDESSSIAWFKSGGFAEAMRKFDQTFLPEAFNPQDFAMPEVKAAKFESMIAKNIESGMFEKEPLDLLERPDVNSYQSMGLSLGGDTLTRKADKTNDILNKIDSRLQGIERGGLLRF